MDLVNSPTTNNVSFRYIECFKELSALLAVYVCLQGVYSFVSGIISDEYMVSSEWYARIMTLGNSTIAGIVAIVYCVVYSYGYGKWCTRHLLGLNWCACVGSLIAMTFYTRMSLSVFIMCFIIYSVSIRSMMWIMQYYLMCRWSSGTNSQKAWSTSTMCMGFSYIMYYTVTVVLYFGIGTQDSKLYFSQQIMCLISCVIGIPSILRVYSQAFHVTAISSSSSSLHFSSSSSSSSSLALSSRQCRDDNVSAHPEVQQTVRPKTNHNQRSLSNLMAWTALLGFFTTDFASSVFMTFLSRWIPEKVLSSKEGSVEWHQDYAVGYAYTMATFLAMFGSMFAVSVLVSKLASILSSSSSSSSSASDQSKETTYCFHYSLTEVIGTISYWMLLLTENHRERLIMIPMMGVTIGWMFAWNEIFPVSIWTSHPSLPLSSAVRLMFVQMMSVCSAIFANISSSFVVGLSGDVSNAIIYCGCVSTAAAVISILLSCIIRKNHTFETHQISE